jgi:hypothetical protein
MFSTNALKIARFMTSRHVSDESKKMVGDYIRANVAEMPVSTGGSWGGATAFVKFTDKYNDSTKKTRVFPKLFGVAFVVNSGLDASHVVPCSAGGNLTASNLWLEVAAVNQKASDTMTKAQKAALRAIKVKLPWDLEEMD